MLELSECSAAYGPRMALSSVTLTVPAGRTACIVGPSGCGKTTLLMLAAGLKEPSAGTVRVAGEPARPGNRRVGLVLQHYGLFPWFTARQNVELGLAIRGTPVAERRRIAVRELERAGLEGCGNLYPSELSGGQQQRVAIARAYALEPGLLLMDEPFSALDALTRETLQDLLLKPGRPSFLLVTHSVEEAVYLGNEIWVLAGSPGRIAGRFENPGQGSQGYRAEAGFFRLCREVRALMASTSLLTSTPLLPSQGPSSGTPTPVRREAT
jgi:ABC-type nitrate/sulfonate/bicarbonate transport system ATPase subunit